MASGDGTSGTHPMLSPLVLGLSWACPASVPVFVPDPDPSWTRSGPLLCSTSLRPQEVAPMASAASTDAVSAGEAAKMMSAAPADKLLGDKQALTPTSREHPATSVAHCMLQPGGT